MHHKISDFSPSTEESESVSVSSSHLWDTHIWYCVANELPPRQVSIGSPFHSKSPVYKQTVSPSHLSQSRSKRKTWTPSSPIQHYFPYHSSLRSVQSLPALIHRPLLSISRQASSSPASSSEAKRNKWVTEAFLVQLPDFQLLRVLLFRKLTRPSSGIRFLTRTGRFWWSLLPTGVVLAA